MVDQGVLEPAQAARTHRRPVLCPVRIEVGSIAALLNAELVEHPVYDGIEVQRFDDAVHGQGLLVFLSRRESRLVDYYAEPGLRLDRSSYALGGGTGRWLPLHAEDARLEVGEFGVDAEVRFTDVDGRRIELRVDDRLAGRRRPGALLAPVGADIDRPASLLLVHLRGFDLVRRVPPDPVIRIDGELVATGRLPGARLHRRHLIKYAAPLTTVMVAPTRDGVLATLDEQDGDVQLSADGRSVTRLRGWQDRSWAELSFEPPFPSLTDLSEARPRSGRWAVVIDGAPTTGGTWRALRRGRRVGLQMEVTEPWEPQAGMPLLLRIVTRVIPTFRRWPTTYRWVAEVELDGSEPVMAARISSRWERTASGLGERYRRTTGS